MWRREEPGGAQWTHLVNGHKLLVAKHKGVALIVVHRDRVARVGLAVLQDLSSLGADFGPLLCADGVHFNEAVSEDSGSFEILHLCRLHHRRFEGQEQVQRLEVAVGEVRGQLGNAQLNLGRLRGRDITALHFKAASTCVLRCDAEQLTNLEEKTNKKA